MHTALSIQDELVLVVEDDLGLPVVSRSEAENKAWSLGPLLSPSVLSVVTLIT
jgi:hypothetical protein